MMNFNLAALLDNTVRMPVCRLLIHDITPPSMTIVYDE